MAKDQKATYSHFPDNIHAFENYTPEWIDLTSISPRSQPWLWYPVIPLETSTLIAGYGGIGKSGFLSFIAAHMTNNKAFDCCGTEVLLPQGSVILLAAEDREDTQLVPNLLAVNADLAKIHLIKSSIGDTSHKRRFLNLDKEISVIEEKIQALEDVKLIIIDPISYFTGDTKDHIQVEVINFIQSMNDLARKYHLAIIFSKHLRKKSGKQTVSSIVDEVGGSASWVNTPRQSFAFVQHPNDEDKVLMFNLKVNIAKRMAKAFCYHIEGVEIEDKGQKIKASKLVWEKKMEEIEMNEAANKETFFASKFEKAKDLIYRHLKENGTTSIKTIQYECSKSDITQRTCQRAYLEMIKEGSVERSSGNYKAHLQLVDGWDGDKK